MLLSDTVYRVPYPGADVSFDGLRFSTMHLPFRFGHSHEQLFVLDRDPARQYFHGIFEVAV